MYIISPWDAQALGSHQTFSVGPFFFAVMLDTFLYGIVSTQAFLYLAKYRECVAWIVSSCPHSSSTTMQGPAVDEDTCEWQFDGVEAASNDWLGRCP